MILIFLFFLIPEAFGAVVQGSLYDSDFNLLKNSIIEINTYPTQTFVSRDGTYKFVLTSGKFNLMAYHKLKNETVLFTSQPVAFPSGGEYTVDLILDTTYEGQDLPAGLDPPLFLGGVNPYMFYSIIGVFVVIIVVLIFFLLRKKRTKIIKTESIESELDFVVKILKKAGGRITQKDLRDNFPNYSEAKVSLIVAEMEEKGLVEKIKKGRGNILILK